MGQWDNEYHIASKTKFRRDEQQIIGQQITRHKKDIKNINQVIQGTKRTAGEDNTKLKATTKPMQDTLKYKLQYCT